MNILKYHYSIHEKMTKCLESCIEKGSIKDIHLHYMADYFSLSLITKNNLTLIINVNLINKNTWKLNIKLKNSEVTCFNYKNSTSDIDLIFIDIEKNIKDLFIKDFILE